MFRRAGPSPRAVCAIGHEWQREPPAHVGGLEDVLDAPQALDAGVEKGDQMGNDQVVVEEFAVAVDRRHPQRPQLFFDEPKESAAGVEDLRLLGHGTTLFARFACQATSKAERKAWRKLRFG